MPASASAIRIARAGLVAGRVGLGDVRRVGRHAVAEQLGVDLRAARLRALELLEHEHAGGLAHHEPVALLRRTAATRAVGSSLRRESARIASKPAIADARDRRLAAAGEHRVGAAEPDRVERVADRHVRGGAGRALAHQRALRAELDRDPARAHVRDDRTGSRTG